MNEKTYHITLLLLWRFRTRTWRLFNFRPSFAPQPSRVRDFFFARSSFVRKQGRKEGSPLGFFFHEEKDDKDSKRLLWHEKWPSASCEKRRRRIFVHSADVRALTWTGGDYCASQWLDIVSCNATDENLIEKKMKFNFKWWLCLGPKMQRSN